jgi:hypothetical protein
MITIIHGDDIQKSREYFLSEKQSAKDPVFFDKEISLTNLTQITQGGSLFTNGKDIFIENFFSAKKANSAELKELIKHIEDNSKVFNFFFWEGKALEKSALSVFSKSAQKAFSLPQSLFLFLDQIKPSSASNIELFHNVLKNAEENVVFYMLIRLLLAVSNHTDQPIDEVKRLAPWQRSKLEKQARLFNQDQLMLTYSDLLRIDLNQKTGTLGTSLVQGIDILLFKI